MKKSLSDSMFFCLELEGWLDSERISCSWQIRKQFLSLKFMMMSLEVVERRLSSRIIFIWSYTYSFFRLAYT